MSSLVGGSILCRPRSRRVLGEQGLKLVRGYGLDEMVVEARSMCALAVLFLPIAGQGNQQHLARGRLGAQSLGDL